MQLNGNQTSVRADAMAAQLSSGAAREIELYEELLAFVDMTPDEQWRYLHPVDTTAANIEIPADVQPAVQGEEPRATESSEAQARELLPELVSSEPALNTADAYTVGPLADPGLEVGPGAPESEEIDNLFDGSGPLADLGLDADLLSTGSQEIENLFDGNADLAESGLGTDLFSAESFELGDLFEDSGPLTELGLNADLGSSVSRKVCPACGAELGIDELFCGECGNFLNGISSASTSNQMCDDCSESVSVDEIFCPWCGFVLDAG